MHRRKGLPVTLLLVTETTMSAAKQRQRMVCRLTSLRALGGSLDVSTCLIMHACVWDGGFVDAQRMCDGGAAKPRRRWFGDRKKGTNSRVLSSSEATTYDTTAVTLCLCPC